MFCIFIYVSFLSCSYVDWTFPFCFFSFFSVAKMGSQILMIKMSKVSLNLKENLLFFCHCDFLDIKVKIVALWHLRHKVMILEMVMVWWQILEMVSLLARIRLCTSTLPDSTTLEPCLLGHPAHRFLIMTHDNFTCLHTSLCYFLNPGNWIFIIGSSTSC